MHYAVFTLMMFSVDLRGVGAAGGPVAGTGGAAVGGTEPGSFGPSTDTLLLSFAVGAVPFASWWLFSRGSGSVADRFANASFSADGGAGGAPSGGPVELTPLTVSDLKNSSRLLCN